MKYHQYLAVILAGSLAACGGGSGSSDQPAASTALTPTAAATASSASSTVVLAKANLAQGMVTGFGSVIVNGVHYDVKNADINVDGDSLVESELGVGQMLRITGTLDSDGIHGKATKVEGESQLRGPIASIDLATGVLVALGQNILLTADTFYQEGVTAESLKVGDFIKVSSYTKDDGTLVATRLEVKTGEAAYVSQLVGKVADLDTSTQTFSINGTTINYSKATFAESVTLANDLLVRVRGNLVEDIFVAEGNIKVSSLNIKHNDQLPGNASVALGGLVTDLVANTSFKLNDVTILLNANTQFNGGAVGDLVDGLQVKVQGALDADKNLVASNIKLILQPQVNENGQIQTVNLDTNTFSLNGVTFAATVDTSFHDSGKDKVRLFSLADLAVGNTVNVRGYKVAATDTTPEYLVATRVERRNAPNGNGQYKVEVHGLVEAVENSTLKVAGHTVTLNAETKIIGFDNLEALLAGALGLNVHINGAIENDLFVAKNIIVLPEGESEWGHSHSSRSANASSRPAQDSRSSRSATSNRSEAAHSKPALDSSVSSRSRSDSSRPAPGGDESHSASSRPAFDSSASSRSRSDSSRPAPGGDESHSASSRPAFDSSASSRPAPGGDGSHSASSRPAFDSSASSRSRSDSSRVAQSSKSFRGQPAVESSSSSAAE
ncbi:MAG TPA: DUF5666 domain-containing protein [Cellvibrio sp.]|nr:DUF5666 domain-containing protein [Cellvibrio sp.]